MLKLNNAVAATLIVAVLFIMPICCEGQELGDQQPDPSMDSVVNLEISDASEFSVYLLNDFSIVGNAVVSSVTTYFTNDNGDWVDIVQEARLCVFSGDFTPFNPPADGQVVPVTVSEVGNGVVAVTVSDLEINLAPGVHWIGLTPIIDSTQSQEFHWSSANQVGAMSVARNPGDGFGVGEDWFTADELSDTFSDASMTIVFEIEDVENDGPFDQQPDPSMDSVVNLEFSDDAQFSVYLLNDVFVNSGTVVNSVTTYFTNDNGDWVDNVKEARLCVFSGNFTPFNPPTDGAVVPVTVTEVGDGVLAVTAAGLDISLVAGVHWIGLTPIITTTQSQEFHWSSDSQVGAMSVARNPGGGFGIGEDWFTADELSNTFSDASITVVFETGLVPIPASIVGFEQEQGPIDQQPDTSMDSVVNLEISDASEFSVYLLNDVVTSTDAVVSSVTTYFTNDNGDWTNIIREARLCVFSGNFTPFNPAADGRIVPVTVTEVGNGVLAVTASGLEIDLAAGLHWIGLTPVIDSTQSQEFHWSSANQVGAMSVARNPGGGFGVGEDWFSSNELSDTFSDASITISFGGDIEGVIAPDSGLIFRGILASGSFQSARASDDQRWNFTPGFTLSSVEAPVWIVFDGRAQSGAGVAVSTVGIESQASTPGLTLTIEEFNFSTGAYEVIGEENASFNVDVQTLTPASGHESNNGAIRCRVGWRQTGFVINSPWEARIDSAFWNFSN